MTQLALSTPTSEATSTNDERYARIIETAKIAVVDNEFINIEVVQGYLEQEGYQHFVRTTDATEAIDLIRTQKPDVVLLNVMMPEVSGLEILASMQADEQLRNIPVIVLTAAVRAETKLQALQLGSSDFLAKPIDASELLLRLRNVLSVKMHQNHLSDLVAAQKELLDRTFTGAVCMMTEII